jgi:hypothetical protein
MPAAESPSLAAADSVGNGNTTAAISDADTLIHESVNILLEASEAEIDAARKSLTEENFLVMADDLMYYRASAAEFLETQPTRFLRMTGRPTLYFLVSGAKRAYDFKNISTLDVVVAYERNKQPRIMATNEVAK